MGHAEWIQNFPVKSDVDLSDGGTIINITPHEAHTGDKAPSIVVGFWERVLVRREVTDSLWTVKSYADGKVLKRHEHEGGDEHRDSRRVRFTHKQPDKRADMELT